MKRNFSSLLIGSIALVLATNVAFAADNAWEDIIKSASAEDFDQEIQSGTNVSGALYGANFQYFITDGDGISDNFSDSDTAQITITAGGTTLTTPSTFSPDDLADWAEDNADKLFLAIFGGDPSSSFGGMDPTTQTSADLSSATTSKNQTVKIYTGEHYSSEIMFGSEKADIDDDGTSVDSTAGIISYEGDLESGNAWGIVVPYRSSSSDDVYGSESKLIAFMPYYKIKTKPAEKLAVDYIINPSFKIIYLESTLFPDGGGYFEYGGGVGVSPSYAVTNEFTLSGNVNLQYSKKSFPESVVPEELKFVAEAINSLPAQKVLSASVAGDYLINNMVLVSGTIIKSSHLDTDAVPEGRDTASTYGVSTTFPAGPIGIKLGYKTVQDVRDYDEKAYMASFSYIW